MNQLALVPVSLREANAFVAAHHRHHPPVRGCKFTVGCAKSGHLCGVAIVGRPVARALDDGTTFELTRLCTDRTQHSASMLVATVARIAKNMGAKRVLTYVLEDERGTSFRAAGWKLRCRKDGQPIRFGGGEWNRRGRRRRPASSPTCRKLRWEICFQAKRRRGTLRLEAFRSL